jgi:hypothetical protein
MTGATVHVAQGCFPRNSRSVWKRDVVCRLPTACLQAAGGRLVGEGE